ncbi:aldehyde dehydrogenase family protein [Bradyrhizobium sp. LHD-71]|uniref:aldehyde dehydrogenase family protein n=1 Tax=Bradyrhizobium sp. LHD-71 TaxID=3072141 RepID=UPI0035BE6884
MIFGNLIDGERIMSGSRTPNINPSDTADIVGEAVRADRAQTNAAIAAAKTAFSNWSRSAPQVRYDLLKKSLDEILARKISATERAAVWLQLSRKAVAA